MTENVAQAREAFSYHLALPPEVRVIFDAYQQEHHLSNTEMSQLVPRWYPIPSVHPLTERKPMNEILEHQVDAYGVIKPYLGDKRFDGTLKTMDIGVGCGRHCGQCLTDSSHIYSLFSFESLDTLFDDPQFQNMLRGQESLRIGSAGDISDHPRAVDIVRMMIEKTAGLDRERMDRDQSHYKIKIFTNYRPTDEGKILGLIGLAEKYPERFDMVISLPVNSTDTVNIKFKQFILKHKDRFPKLVNQTLHPNYLMVFTAKHPELLNDQITPTLRQEFRQYLKGKIDEFQCRQLDGTEYDEKKIDTMIDDHMDILLRSIQSPQKDALIDFLNRLRKEINYWEEMITSCLLLDNVDVQDVRGYPQVYLTGRSFPFDQLRERGLMIGGDKQEANYLARERTFVNRGLSKTLFNPDGLWLKVYATTVESYTTFLYAKFSPENVDLLSRIPYHPDFPIPSSWPGGRGTKNSDYAQDMEKARENYRELKAKIHFN